MKAISGHSICRILFGVGIAVGLTMFGSAVLPHDGDVNSYGCHLTSDNPRGGGPCHCHRTDPNDTTKREACENLRPDLSEQPAMTEPFPRWRGIRVEYETECADYRSDRYSYGPGADINISLDMNAFYAPYEDVCYKTKYDVTIEHMVARKEAHVSGLCRSDQATKLQFSADLDNLTLAHSTVNSGKSDHDAATWLPDHNECWYVFRVMNVKRKYDLSVDPAERDAMQEVLDECSANDLVLSIPESCIDDYNPDRDRESN